METAKPPAFPPSPVLSASSTFTAIGIRSMSPRTSTSDMKEAGDSKKCDICNRSFVRSEHLTRHRRTHTKERPFPCPHCGLYFQRSDVRVAHVKKHHPHASNPQAGSLDSLEYRRKRVKVACGNCRKRKARCDGGEPCSQCRLTASTCSYPTQGSSAERTEGSENHPSTSTLLGERCEESYVASRGNDLASDSSTNGATLDMGSSTFTNIELLHEWEQPALMGETGTTVSPLLNAEGLDPRSNQKLPLNIPDIDMLDDFWQIPGANSAFWLDESDVFWSTEEFDTSALILDHAPSSSSLQNMSLLLQEYFNQKSRAPSPSPTPNKVKSMWFSAPPRLQDHDVDVVNIFLNLFYRHIPMTFTIFEGPRITDHNKPDYVLALAAVGGLFCSVNGSFEIAKAMYNDSRRLLLASVKNSKSLDAAPMNREDIFTVVKNFILLEIYGLCSGDKRSYEFVEAFHADLSKAIRDYSELSQYTLRSPCSEVEKTHLLESLYILDGYRVLLMQRPPSLFWRHRNSFCQHFTPGDSLERLHNLVTAFTTPGSRISPDDISVYNLASLAALSTFSWPTIPSVLNDHEPSSSIWKTDFAELACDSWFRAQADNIDASSLVFYHMMNIAFHANFILLQNFAHSSHSSATSEHSKNTSKSIIQAWVHSRHYSIARWHAESLVDCTEKSTASSTKNAAYQNEHGRMPPPSIPTELSLVMNEAPHIPYAIYYATLVLWCGDVVLDNSRLAGISHLVRGGQILSRYRVRIAQLLERILKEIKR